MKPTPPLPSGPSSRTDAGVLIVDDSAVMRQMLTNILIREPGIRVIGTASDPLQAQTVMQKEWPSVIVLDIEMPHMDGLTFLRKIMRERPTPVVICSGLTASNVALTLDALNAGAVSVIGKPTGAALDPTGTQGGEFRRAILEAVSVNARRMLSLLEFAPRRTDAASALPRLPRFVPAVVGLGISTGGPQTLERLLGMLRAPTPAIVVVQHMPPGFTGALARRLNGLGGLPVVEAEPGMSLTPDRVYIAPAGRHAEVRPLSLGTYGLALRDGERVSQHIPSVDILFSSLARHCGLRSVGVLMTGMGQDGARGLLEMRQAGAVTIAQDQNSSVVFGMPRAAIELEAAEAVLDITGIADYLASLRRSTRADARQAAGG